MKICLFLHSATVGGAERVAINLANRLIVLDHQVQIVLIQGGGHLENQINENVEISYLDANSMKWAFLALGAFVRKQRPDILLSFLPEANSRAILASVLFRKGPTVIPTEHSAIYDNNGELLRNIGLEKFLYKLVDLIVAVSDGVADDVTRYASIRHEKIKKVHNPVIHQDIIGCEYEMPNHEWLKDEELPVIISGGRHVPQKNFHLLIGTFDRIIQEVPETRLILFGEGPLTKDYRIEIKNKGLGSRVDVVGYVPDPLKYLKHSDVFVLSSNREGLPTVMIEALATGTPVVSTDCPHGPAEILSNGKYGKLVPPRDSAALCEGIKSTLQTPIDPSTLQARAQSFTIERQTDKFLSLMKNNV
jgi:glycosyltransferase involved in cell wall biosynthesis